LGVEIRYADCFPCRPEWKIDPHLIEHYGLFYVLRGKGWLDLDGQRLDMRAGDLFCTRPGMRVSAGHDPKDAVTVFSTGFVLNRSGVADPFQRFNWPARMRLSPERRRRFQALFMELTSEHNAQTLAGGLAARGALFTLFAEALRLSADTSLEMVFRDGQKGGGEETRLAAVLEFIDRNLAKPLTLAALAREAHLSPVYFAALFRKLMQRTPMSYLRQRRMELARMLLASPEKSIEAVAREVGFADPFHFSRVFRRATGLAPSAFREQLKNPFAP
jgi:AraC-like DNA-binding protein